MVTLSPDGTKFATCSYDNSIKIWRLSENKDMFSLHATKENTYARFIEWSPNSNLIVATANAIQIDIKVWKLSEYALNNLSLVFNYPIFKRSTSQTAF